MRSKSPELMNQICKYVEKSYLQSGHSPSTSMIGEAVGIARGTVYKYLVEMSNRGMIEYDGQEIQTPITKKANTDIAQTAIVGNVSSGASNYEEENIEEYVALPTAIFGSGEFYILRASDDSMIHSGIGNDDLVVVRKQNTANEGDIVVALVNDKTTLKRFHRDAKSKKIILQSENEKDQDIIVDECLIQGVACNVIKRIQAWEDKEVLDELNSEE